MKTFSVAVRVGESYSNMKIDAESVAVGSSVAGTAFNTLEFKDVHGDFVACFAPGGWSGFIVVEPDE